MYKDNIEKFFKQLGKGYDSPNSGGCGLFAVAASTALKNLGVKHKIIVNCWSKWQVDEFTDKYGPIKKSVSKHYQQLIKAGANGVAIHNHIAIQIGEKMYDVKGLYSAVGQHIYTIDYNTLSRLVKIPKQWNSAFRNWNDANKIKPEFVKHRAVKISNKILKTVDKLNQ